MGDDQLASSIFLLLEVGREEKYYIKTVWDRLQACSVLFQWHNLLLDDVLNLTSLPPDPPDVKHSFSSEEANINTICSKNPIIIMSNPYVHIWSIGVINWSGRANKHFLFLKVGSFYLLMILVLSLALSSERWYPKEANRGPQSSVQELMSRCFSEFTYFLRY